MIDFKVFFEKTRLLVLWLSPITTTLYSLHGRADLLLYKSPTVDIWVDMNAEPTDPALTPYRARAETLAHYYDENILSILPSRLRTQWGATKTVLRFEKNLPLDGIFIPKEEMEKLSKSQSTKTPHTRKVAATHTEQTVRIKLSHMLSSDAEFYFSHEFFHAFHFTINKGEPAWVREGLAMIFENLVSQASGKNRTNAAAIKAGFTQISTPLFGEYDLLKPDAALYGHHYLYFNYLIKNCGGFDLFWKMVEGKPAVFGRDNIDSALKESSIDKAECKNFSSSIEHFEVARAHNKRRYDVSKLREQYFIQDSVGEAQTLSPETKLTPKITNLSPAEPLLIARSAWDAWIGLKQPNNRPTPKIQNDPNIRIYYLQRQHPYAVSTDASLAPASQGFTQVLVLKVP